MAGAPDHDALRSEYNAFFRLLSNERGIKLRLNLPDTLVLDHGEPLAWIATNKDGYVVQRPASRTSFEDVRQHLLSCALDGSGRYLQHVAVLRFQDGLPKLLTRPALDDLCSRLDARLVAGDASAGSYGDELLPCLLQAYVPPFLDLRYVTSYTNDGAATSCHTFQRRYSRRYLHYRPPAVLPSTPSMLAGSPGAPPTNKSGTAAAEGQFAKASSVGSPCAEAASSCAPGGSSCDADGEVVLDDGALADSERSLGKSLGPVDPSLKMLARKAAHGLVQYVQKAHLLTLRGLVCEFARDGEGHLWFLGPLRAEWASMIPGRGGEPWANANLTQQPRDEESWPSTVAEEVAEAGAHSEAGLPGGPQQDGEQRWLAGQGKPAVLLGAQPQGSTASAGLLPPSALPQLEAQQPGSPGIPARLVLAQDAAAGSPVQCQLAGSLDSPLRSPQQQLALKAGLRRSPSPHSGQREPVPGSPGSNARQAMHATSTGAATCGSHRAAGSGSPQHAHRGLAVLTSHLTKEVVALRDDLLAQTDLADALASKVAALEHDKHVITAAFEQVVDGMQGDLREVKERLEALRGERDRLACQLAEAEQKLGSTEAERERLQGMLDAERGTAFLSLGQFQKQQEDAGVRAARAEAELRSVQERLQEEQAACGALKKQMVFYHHSLGTDGSSSPPGVQLADGSRPLGLRVQQERPELKYAETLQAVDELLMREADPTGERYSLSKVLHTCQADLHATFLHYSMLDANFARHWPPQLSLAGWLAFMKDIGSTNLVPGTRTRSDNTMHVQEATEVFRRYCLRQAVMKGTLPAHALSTCRDSSTAALAAVAVAGDQPPRPPSSQSIASAATTSRPFSAAAAAQLASASMSYQSFCAALVHVAGKMARSSAKALEACPFLSEQTRAFVEAILVKAQRVAPIVQTTKKAGVGSLAGSPVKQPLTGGMGAKEAAAKEAAAKLPKLKKARSKAALGGAAAGRAVQEMSAIAEASREGRSSSQHLGPSGDA